MFPNYSTKSVFKIYWIFSFQYYNQHHMFKPKLLYNHLIRYHSSTFAPSVYKTQWAYISTFIETFLASNILIVAWQIFYNLAPV